MVMVKEDYYKILGLKKDASEKEIKNAFRRLARKYHPDLNPNNKVSEQKFKELNEAYEVLSDPKKREKFDKFGHAGLSGEFANGEEGWQTTGSGGFKRKGANDIFNENGMDFSDVFHSIFGDRERKTSRRPEKGNDITTKMDIDFRDAILGKQSEISLQKESTCKKCGGTGKGCNICKGSGRTFQTEKISIKIPAGIEDGSNIRLTGKGELGLHGSLPGDLYIKINIRPDRFFERKEADLHCEVPITFDEAVFGAKIDVPTINGKAKITIPGGTQSGQIFRLKGKGVPYLNGSGSGDQYVKVKLVIPEHIEEKDSDIVKEVGKLYTEDPRRGLF